MAKKAFITGALALILLSTFVGAGAQPIGPGGDVTPVEGEFAPDQLLIRFRPGVGHQRVSQILGERGATSMRAIEALDVHVLKLPPGLSVEQAVQVFSHMPEVEFAEPNYILHAVAPMRTEIDDQWGLNKIQAPEAWAEFGQNPPSALIATVDTGIDSSHSDLAANIWKNASEIAGNGLDDDNNGYIDDTWGWDFVNNDNDPYDDNMHGTYVSSIEAAVRDGSGVAGVCPWCQVMAVKVLSSIGSGTLDQVANGITYAADNGARVVNLSLAGAVGSATLEQAVNYAWNAGALVVAAAGNDGAETMVYPAGYKNAMAVASTNSEDFRSCFSNYGDGYISVAAPGEAIEGAVPNGGYETHSGTSAAAPHVSGLGGLLFSQNPDLTNVSVRTLIETTTNDLGPVYTDAFFGTGRINAYRAVTGNTAHTDPPSGMFVDDLTASGYAHARKLARDNGGTLHMVWHGRSGDQYQVLYSTSVDNGATWSESTVVFSSSAETYHPALAIDESNVYIAFPSKDGGSNYQIFFTSKVGEVWSPATPVISVSGDAVRPDLYLDPSNHKLHLVASSLDNAPYVYYRASDDGGGSWEILREVNVDSTSGQNTRYADVHAHGDKVYIAGRTVKFTFWGLLPEYRVFAIRSEDGGASWSGLTELAYHSGFWSGEYGVSLAGVGDRLYLAYEHNNSILFRESDGGVGWSDVYSHGGGKWPSITQGEDGQAWLLWEAGGQLTLRHYSSEGIWETPEGLGVGNYPNFKLGTSGDVVEWTATHCSGAPFRMMFGSRSIAMNNPPEANADGPYSGTEDLEIDFDGSGSSDPEGDTLTYTWDFGDSSTGSGVSPSHVYTYGSDFTVTLTVTDGKGGSDVDLTTASVVEVNDPPVADPNGPYSGSVGDSITFDGSGSFDPDNGDGTVVNDQTLSYTWEFGDGTTGVSVNPAHAYSAVGEYSVSLTVNDGSVDSEPMTTTASIVEVNNPPVAVDDAYTTNEDTPLSVGTPGVLSNDTDGDGDPLSAVLVADASNGLLTLNPNGSFTYIPYENFFGTDGFTYVANDGSANSNEATVSIDVYPVNDSPVANNDAYSTNENTPLTVEAPGILGNDTDVDGDSLTASLVNGVSHGTVALNGNGSFNYAPDVDFYGTDSFTYVANDGSVESNIATVTIDVNALPKASFAHDCTGFACEFDATDSYDPDGTIMNYSWDFGDGNTGSVVAPSHEYMEPGTYTVILTVTDDDGATDTDNQDVEVSGLVATMHVGDLDGASEPYGRWWWFAKVTIMVHNSNHLPVAEVLVTGNWNGSHRGIYSCTTNEMGLCTVTSRRLGRWTGSVEFNVERLDHPTLEYAPGDNDDPDDDSDGTSITVPRPW